MNNPYNLNFTEIYKLDKALTYAHIPHRFGRLYDGYQIVYPDCEPYDKKRICDAVIHFGTYGCEQGLLEIMGLVDEEEIGDEVEGFLTAQEVFQRIFNHFINQKRD